MCQLPQSCAEDVLNTLQDSHTPLALEMRRMLRANYERDNDLTLTGSSLSSRDDVDRTPRQRDGGI